MIRVMMICYGNICRSPMAEFLLRDMVQKRDIADKFHIASAATSTEEIGNGVHYGSLNAPTRTSTTTLSAWTRRTSAP